MQVVFTVIEPSEEISMDEAHRLGRYVFSYVDESGIEQRNLITLEGPFEPIGTQMADKPLRIRNVRILRAETETSSGDLDDSAAAPRIAR